MNDAFLKNEQIAGQERIDIKNYLISIIYNESRLKNLFNPLIALN
jgi:hypothetical protein